MNKKRSYKLDVLSSEVIFSKFGKKLLHERLKVGDSEILDWYYLDTPNSVLIVPVTKNGKVVLVKQNKFNLKKYTQEFPAGTVDSKDEDILDAVKRELFEETGYVSNKFVSLGKYYLLPSETNRWVHIYLAENAEKKEEPLLDSEIEKYFDISVDEFDLDHLINEPTLLEGLEHRFALDLVEKYLIDKKN